jgi:hypothetical protein
VRVLPAQGPRGQHDYAELPPPPYQTPPYFSVSPLLVSSDFSFRAQDAVGWNPQRFRYAASREEFQKLAGAYDAYLHVVTPVIQQTLAELVNRAPEGEMDALSHQAQSSRRIRAGTRSARREICLSGCAKTNLAPGEGITSLK